MIANHLRWLWKGAPFVLQGTARSKGRIIKRPIKSRRHFVADGRSQVMTEALSEFVIYLVPAKSVTIWTSVDRKRITHFAYLNHKVVHVWRAGGLLRLHGKWSLGLLTIWSIILWAIVKECVMRFHFPLAHWLRTGGPRIVRGPGIWRHPTIWKWYRRSSTP